MTEPDGDERDAIAALKASDIDGLEFLVKKHQVHAVRAAFLVTHDLTSAEDVVQSAFLRVYERMNQFDSDRRFQPWFLRIVINDAVKAATRSRRELSMEQMQADTDTVLDALVANADSNPATAAERAETARAVHDALAKLSPNQRAAVVLRYYLGLKEAEIAARIGRARGTVKWLLHAARQRLGPLLSASGEGPPAVQKNLEGDEK